MEALQDATNERGQLSFTTTMISQRSQPGRFLLQYFHLGYVQAFPGSSWRTPQCWIVELRTSGAISRLSPRVNKHDYSNTAASCTKVHFQLGSHYHLGAPVAPSRYHTHTGPRKVAWFDFHEHARMHHLEHSLAAENPAIVYTLTATVHLAFY